MMSNNIPVIVTGTGQQQQQQQQSGQVPLIIQHSNDVDEELQRVTIALNTVFGGGGGGGGGTISNSSNGGDPNNNNIYTILQCNRQYADQYLVSFQKQPISWMVCDRLLSKMSSSQENNTSTNNSSVEQQWWFFASQTIHRKCCTNIYDLPYNTLPSLRDSLLQHLYRFCSIQQQVQQSQQSQNQQMQNQSFDALVYRLAMCISALAVQMGWISIIQDILSYDNNTTLDKNSNTTVIMLLLQTLPEECASDKLLLVDDNTRYQIRDQLISSASIVFTYLVSQLQNNTTGSTSNTNELVLKVFLIWVRYVPIRPNTLVETPLLINSIRALNIPIDTATNTLKIQSISIKFLELAADVVIEVLHMYPSHHYNNEQLVRTMIPELSQLSFDTILGMLISGHEQTDTNTIISDIQQIYSRIVIEMGESYITLLLSATEYKQYTKIINYILYCSQCTNNNNNISNMTFHFWYTFVNDIDTIQPYEYRQELIDYYTNYLLSLINICCTNLMKYPIDIIDDDDTDYDPTDIDDRMDDIINHRLYVSETIEDCCRLLGGHIVLTEIGNYLKNEVQRVSSASTITTSSNKNEQWIGIESGIACVIALHKFVTADDNDIIPYCCSLIPQLSSSLPSRRLLQSTCCQFIGKYSFWIVAAATKNASTQIVQDTNMIPSLLAYLSDSLQIPTCTTHAATSIIELCKKSNTIFQLSEPVLNLYETYAVNNNNNTNQQQRQLPISDELLLLQGVCLALSRTIQDNYTTVDSRQYLLRLAQPIIQRLGVSIQHQQHLQQQTNDTTSFLQNTILPDIDRLTTIIMHLLIVYDPNQGTIHPIIELLQSIWNIIETIIQRYPKSTDVAEKICRLHKYSIRSCGIHSYRIMLEPLVQHIIQCFTITQQSPYLYLASICISEYKDDINSATATGTAERFVYMISSMANKVFTFIQSFIDITNHPDIVEEFFYLMGRMIDYFPIVFITNRIIQSICDCSIIAIQIEHQGGQKGTLKFLDSLLSYGVKLRSSVPGTGITIKNNDVTVAYEMILGHIGPAITVQLVRILIGDLPSYGNQASDIIHKMNQLCTKQLSIWLLNGMTSSNGNNVAGGSSSSITPGNNNNNSFVNWIPEHARNEFISAIDMQLSHDDFNLIVSAFQQACDRERRRIRRS